jgi:RHS repeat-associated protein
VPNRRLLTGLAMISVFICSVSSVKAQDETPTAVTDQNRSGDLPFSGVIGSDIEHVVVTTGDLVVNIPIADLPGRGGRFHFALRYDGRYLVTALRGSNYIWNISRANYLPSNGLWQTNVPLMTYTTYSLKSCGPNITGNINGLNNFIFLDRDGAYHPVQTGREIGSCEVGGQSSSYSNSVVGGQSWSYTNRGPDTTGAGMWAGIGAIGHSQISPGPAGLYLADGSQPGFSSTNGYDPVTSTIQNVLGNIQDPNGNSQSEYSGGDDTLGRVIVSEQDNTNQIVYTVKDSSGSSQTYTVNFTNLSIHTQFDVSGVQEYSGTRSVVSSIVLPNGREYSFSYDNYGSLTEITLPTGGTISYIWGNFPGGIGTYRYVTSRTVTVGSQVSKWTFLQSGTAPCSFPNPNSLCDEVTVTDPLNNQTVYEVGEGVTAAAMIYQGAAVGTPLRTYTVIYTDMNLSNTNLWLPTKVTTQLDNKQVSETDYQYDSFTYTYYSCATYSLCSQNGPVGSPYMSSRGNVTDIKQYDWGNGSPGPLLREEKKTYLHDSNSNYLNANIVDKVLVDTIYNGSGTQVAQTQYVYDNYTSSTAMVPTSSVPQHNYTSFSTSNIYRGNATQVERWLNPGNALLTTSYTYDDLGNIRTIQDPLLNSTNYSYTDSFANTACPPPANSLAYVSQVTNALSQNIQIVRYPCTGLVQAHLDQNDINAGRAGTTYSYDLLGRVTQKNLPDGGQVSTSYDDVPPISSTSTTKITASLNLVNTTERDGLGRVTQTQLNSDPVAVTYVDTTYDLLGRKSTVSNPHRTVSEPTDGVTTYTYDPLNRITLVKNPDSSTLQTVYTGRATKVTDEGNGTKGVQRISQSDALGRLTSVCEVSSTTLTFGTSNAPIACGQDIAATGFLTSYQYDALGNLLSVSQGSLNPRTFVYDSLSRLTSSTNPESGTMSYTYDKNGNMTLSTGPAPNQTNPAVTGGNGYSYDALNRLYFMNSTNNSLESNMWLYYDQSGHGNSIGRLTEKGVFDLPVNNWFSNSTFTYDPMGRVTTLSECTTQNCPGGYYWSLTYGYDFLGDVTSWTDAFATTFSATYDGTGRMTSVANNLSNASYPSPMFSVATYNAPGLLTSATIGSGTGALTENRGYNNRLRPTTLTDGAAYSFNISNYAPDGNILAVTDSVNGSWGYGTGANYTGGYDDLNRLLTSIPSGQTWSYSYAYDRYGNRWQQNLNGTGGSGPAFSTTFDTNNRVSDGSVTYDAAGNVMKDAFNSYTYDYHHRILSTLSLSTGVLTCYLYDIDGRRVQRVTAATACGYPPTGGTSLYYVYDSSGHLIDEVSAPSGSTGNWTREEVYAGGRHLATFTPGTGGQAYWDLADWLGTERARVNAVNGAVSETCTSLPWGDNLQCSSTDISPLHFTGKERDSESNLDNFGARYYSSSMGRMLSPDWSARPVPAPFANLTDPQTLNLYSFVRNNPLSRIDSDGHCGAPAGLQPGQVGICVASFIKSSTIGYIGRGDGRETNGNGGTSRIETRLIVDPSKGTVTKSEPDKLGRSGIVFKEFGPQGKGEAEISKPTTDKDGTVHFQVSQDAFSSTHLFGHIDNHINLGVTDDQKVVLEPGSTAKDFPSTEAYRYTIDGQGNVTTTLIFYKEESGQSGDLEKDEKPIVQKPFTPQKY